jgi:hypothetical protein
MTALHKDLDIGEIHVAHQWEYADEAARLAATGFVPADVHKLALQLNDNTLWLLVDDDPITWAQMNPVDPTNINRIGTRCLKSTSGSIAKGKAVYFVGVDPGTGFVLVEKADASNAAKMPAIGVTDTAITEAVSGVVVVIGGVENTDTSSWVANDALYVSGSVAGDLTNVRPTGANQVQLKAYASVIHATYGVLGCVSVQALSSPNLASGKIWVGGAGNGEPETTDWAHASRHKGGGADVIDGATPSLAGLMSAADKTKLDGMTTVRERFFLAETATALITGSPLRVREIGSTSAWDFDFAVPNDFSSLVSLEAIGIPNASFSNKGIYLASVYGAVGEAYNTHAEADNTKTYSGTIGQWTAISVASVFSALAAGDICGIRVDHQTLTTTMNYVGVRLRYNTSG